MTKIDVVDAKGKKTTTADLDDSVFAIVPNGAVLHQVVTAQLAARRAGTQSTKTRAEVAGGGAKPWKQKGTGRARQGSIRSPQWAGGGVAHGPKPRSYAQRTPKKMVRLALRSALSDRSSDGKVKVVDFGWDAPKTAQAVAALADLGIEGKVLLVLKPDDHATWKSFRNLGDVHILTPSELNAYDILVSDWVVFTPGTVPADTPLSRGGQGTAKASGQPAARGGAPGDRDEVPTVPADAVEAPEPSEDHVEAPVADAGSEEE
ncbi:MAG: 50S ribosomal protein L4 [Iamia sp.]